jgi:hypothetical protein
MLKRNEGQIGLANVAVSAFWQYTKRRRQFCARLCVPVQPGQPYHCLGMWRPSGWECFGERIGLGTFRSAVVRLRISARSRNGASLDFRSEAIRGDFQPVCRFGVWNPDFCSHQPETHQPVARGIQKIIPGGTIFGDIQFL